MKVPALRRAFVLPLIFGAVAAFTPHSRAAGPADATQSNRAVVNKAFVDWKAGHGSFYDLMSDDSSVTIAGQSPHSGTFSKTAFLRDRAKPFQARFATPIVPTRWTIWAVDDEVIVRWESRATDCEGKPYTNSYAYFITMKGSRATALTMFLDMGAFDDVWNRCRPADERREGAR